MLAPTLTYITYHACLRVKGPYIQVFRTHLHLRPKPKHSTASLTERCFLFERPPISKPQSLQQEATYSNSLRPEKSSLNHKPELERPVYHPSVLRIYIVESRVSIVGVTILALWFGLISPILVILHPKVTLWTLRVRS